MDTFAINEGRKPPRIGRLAMVSGALLCTMGAAAPALSADLPYDDGGYRDGYYRDGSDSYAGYSGYSGYPGYDRSSYPYDYRYAPRSLGPYGDPVSERLPAPRVGPPPMSAIAERYWAEREYYERNYPYYLASTQYGYPPPGYSRYTQYPPGPQYGPYTRPPYYSEHDPYAGYRGPHGWSRDSSIQYPPYRASYQYQADPRNPYRYADTARPPYYRGYRPEYEYRPPYERDAGQRSPTGGPDGYYNYGPRYPQ